MLTQTWVIGIAVAVVAGSLAVAWRAIRACANRSAMPAEDAAKNDAGTKRREPERRWRLYLNEAEIARRLNEEAIARREASKSAPTTSADKAIAKDEGTASAGLQR